MSVDTSCFQIVNVSSVSSSVISPEMLYIFRVDTGSMLTLDMGLALETVAHLKVAVETSCAIPQEKQVLLISGNYDDNDYSTSTLNRIKQIKSPLILHISISLIPGFSFIMKSSTKHQCIALLWFAPV